MILTSPLDAYFHATNAHDTNALVACFDADATVFDEGEEQTFQGIEAIREWAETLNKQYQLSVEVLGMEEAGNRTLVTASVSGDFEGSPLQFKYYFTLKGDKISKLEIQP